MKGDPSPPLIIDVLLLLPLVVAALMCSFISVLLYVLIAGQIGALSKGFLVGQSTPGHLILLACGQAPVRLTRSLSHLLTSLSFFSRRLILSELIWVKYSHRTTKAVGMTSSGGEKGGFHSKKGLCWFSCSCVLRFWLNISEDDDLIHNAHYGSLEMLIVS